MATRSEVVALREVQRWQAKGGGLMECTKPRRRYGRDTRCGKCTACWEWQTAGCPPADDIATLKAARDAAEEALADAKYRFDLADRALESAKRAKAIAEREAGK